jgi:hypothetical protein
MPKFHSLERLGLQPDWYVTLDAVQGKGISEEDLWAYLRADRLPENPIPLRLHGRKKVDMVYGLDMFFAGERVMECLQNFGFTGWRTIPVRVVGATAVCLSGIAFGGRADRKLHKPGDVPCFDIGGWDGSDFFMLEDSGLMFVSDRVATAFEKAGITGVTFDPVKTKGRR